jgi:hypothetical protein
MKTLNQWFLSLVSGRQAVLVEDKWMLANAAFEAGSALKQEEMQVEIDLKQERIAALEQQLAALQAAR